MKTRALLLPLLAPLFFACSKTDAVPGTMPLWRTATIGADEGCAQNITQPATAHSLPAAQVALADNLFDRNNLPHANLRYFQYQRDSLRNAQPPTRVLNELVRVTEYANGLKVFTAPSNFIFWNGSFHFRAGTPTGGTSLGTVPQLTLPQLRWLFKETIAQFDPHNALSDQCINAEFGYYDLNAGNGNQPENLVKAWRVTKQGQQYPFAYFQDAGCQLIYYDNGIRTFR
jgi:hypothetical protein